VLAFEPQPHIFYNLCANVFLNGFSNIEPFNKALYNHAGFMQVARRSLQDVDVPMNELGIDYSAFDNHGAVAFEPINSGEGIPCVTVDSLAVDNLALLVTDCQGADFRILRGAKETIQRCRPIVMFESERNLERERGISRQLYKLFFSDLNYKMSAVRGHINDPQTEYLAVPIERRQQFARFLGGG
jgi:FkbM family methyltransferase